MTQTHAHVPPGGAHHRHAQPDAEGQAEILELDAEVLAEHTTSIITWLPTTTEPRRILDLGCGTGAGTFALLASFPSAEVTAVDASESHLHRLRDKAEALGVADRVRTVLVDLDAEWPDLGKPELAWASASMHHLTDPDRTLRKIHDLLAPGGLFAVVELAGLPRFLPEDAPLESPGLEERCHAALAHQHAEQMPHRGADWGPKLTVAGFQVEGKRTVTVNIDGSGNDAVGRYAHGVLSRLRERAADVLEADAVSALGHLLDPADAGSVLRRGDLALRTERTVWAARRH